MANTWEIFKRWADKLRQAALRLAAALGRLRHRLPSRYVTVPAAVAAWILSGFYVIAPGERGAVLCFGKLDRVTEPGLHYHLPRPMEKVIICDVEKVQRYEIAARMPAPGMDTATPTAAGEAILLTSDESLIAAKLVVQVRVSSVVDYLCNLDEPEKTIQDAGLAALSAVIGRTGFDSLFTEENQLGIEAQIGTLLQKLLDSYQSGIQVVAAKLKRITPPAPVTEAFAQVTQAREEQRQSEAQALQYENRILPEAKGEATRIVEAAEAFKLQKISQAQGDADRFMANLKAYRRASEVTRKRLYLETAEQIVGHASKVVISSEDQMVWPLEQLLRPASPASKPAQEAK